MKQSTTSTYLDWEIRTVMGIDNPDDWKPGDPDRYFVRAIATLSADGDRFSYSSDQPQIVDTEHFNDERLAPRYHGQATMRLQAALSKLRLQ